MTLFLCDGMDFIDSNATARASGWLPFNSTMGASTTAGRFGGGALSGTNSNRFYRAPDVPFNGLNDTLIIQFALKFADNSPSTVDLINFLQFSNIVATLALTSATQLFFKDDAGSTASGTWSRSGQLIPNVWNYIQVKFTFNGTTGSAEAKINGLDSVMIVTNADFFNTIGITEIEFEGNTSSTWYIDDIIIMDGNGSKLNDFIGDCRVTTILPTSDVLEEWLQSESGPSYELVDDPKGGLPDDTTYIESDTPGDEHRFGFEDCPANTGTVHALNVLRQGRKLDASDRTVRSLVLSNASEGLGGHTRLLDDYFMTRDIFELDPDGSVDWDEASINAVEIGVEVVT